MVEMTCTEHRGRRVGFDSSEAIAIETVFFEVGLGAIDGIDVGRQGRGPGPRGIGLNLTSDHRSLSSACRRSL